jgi:sporulation-control protein spo0M
MGLLSRLGIGAASVEPVLRAPRVTAGETVPVRVTVEGGSDGQCADALTVRLATVAGTNDGMREVTLATATLATDLTVEAGARRAFDGELAVPVWAPATREGTEVVLAATLAMDWARAPTGRTAVEVDVGPRLDRALAALVDLGIAVNRVRPVDATTAAREATAPAADRELPIVQRFDCHPRAGPYVGRIRRLTLVAAPAPGGLTCYASADVDPDAVHGRTGGFERFATVEVTDQRVSTLRKEFERALGTGSTTEPSLGR